MGTTILIVAQDPALASTSVAALQARGHDVWHAASGAEAKARLAQGTPDLVILDLLLPDLDGLVLCADLLEQADVSVIVCSERTHKQERILSLKLGAAAVLTKPLDRDELAAQVAAVLNRASRLRATDRPPAATDGVLRLGALVVDQPAAEVRLDGTVLPLTPTEHRLLVALLSHPNQVLTRADLGQAIWASPDVQGSRAIDTQVYRLRAKLSASQTGAPQIVSVRGFGYKLVGELSAAAEAARRQRLVPQPGVLPCSPAWL